MKEDSTVATGSTFLVTDQRGRPSRSHDGFYHADTRHLCDYTVSLADTDLETLSVTAPRPGERVVHAASELSVGARALGVRREQVVTDGLYERVELTNHTGDDFERTLTVSLGARFEDMFEVRGHNGDRDRTITVRERDGGVTFAYDPEDVAFERATTVVADRETTVETAGGDCGEATLRIPLSVPAGETAAVTLAVAPEVRDSASAPGSQSATDADLTDPTAAFDAASATVRERERTWYERVERPDADRTDVTAVLDQSVEDLLALTLDTDHGPVFAAGTPWFATGFGRDSLIAAYQALPLTREVAAGTLRYLAAHQADAEDDFRDAQPGKILHEIRHGECTVRGETPHAPYYGTIDATALWVVLLHETWRWTGDDGLVTDLRENLAAALDWLDDHGDRDGDGFLEYPTDGGDGGLTHQAWKDSGDGIMHPDGTHPTGPLAVAEAQGYAYDAKRRAAKLYRGVFEDEARAAELESAAEALAARFDEAFWLDDEEFYAVALDGDNDPVECVATNPGHCLWSSIVPDERADAVVDRLLADDMFSGWGIRTVSADHPVYNPQSYHLGSVWPHDNSLAALGMAAYGRRDAARRVADGLFEAARARGNDRLPELFAGVERRKTDAPLPYGEACEPQAWAAAAPVACLWAVQGDGPETPRSSERASRQT